MKSKSYHNGWEAAVYALAQYLANPCKSEIIIKRFRRGLATEDVASLQKLFYGSLRNLRLSDQIIREFVRKSPRPKLKAALQVAIYDILSTEGSVAPCIHFAVEQIKKICSKGEAKFANAVLRKVKPQFDVWEEAFSEKPERWGVLYSHPEWMVKHWLKEFTPNEVKALLEWNQSIPAVFVRGASDYVPFLESTRWPGFSKMRYDASSELEALLEQPGVFVCDPSTHHPIELLELKEGDSVLDLCAAPGGKSRQILQKIGNDGFLCSVDLPNDRLQRLEENLKTYSNAVVLGTDLLNLSDDVLREQCGIAHFDKVLLDAPCSNMGVLRRRVDARWRIKEKDISSCADLQLALLQKASEYVKPGGILVYSTCSIEHEENEAVAAHFMETLGSRFSRGECYYSYPWREGHDGGGAVAFKRIS